MRKLGYMVMLIFLLMILNGCRRTKFNGSSTGNDNQFIMEYSILNTSDYRKMSLKTGDIINTSVVSNSGSVSIEVEDGRGEIIYLEKDIPTSDFEIVIPQDDTYKFTVTGHNAKGSVSFIKDRESS